MSNLLAVVNSVADFNNTVSETIFNKMQRCYSMYPSSTFQFLNFNSATETFVSFITKLYNSGYRIIIGNINTNDSISAFPFLISNPDLFLFSSFAVFNITETIPNNFFRFSSTIDNSFLQFKSNNLNELSLSIYNIDPTLTFFPNQKQLIINSESTFVKTFNVIYTDEDTKNIDFVNFIKTTESALDPYVYKYYLVPKSIITQGQLTPEAALALSTTNYSNVFFIISSYGQTFLNILTSNPQYLKQIIFTTFVSDTLTLNTNAPYIWSFNQNIIPSQNFFYQIAAYNNQEGYVSPFISSIYEYLTEVQNAYITYLNKNITNIELIGILNKSVVYTSNKASYNYSSIIKIPWTVINPDPIVKELSALSFNNFNYIDQKNLNNFVK